MSYIRENLKHVHKCGRFKLKAICEMGMRTKLVDVIIIGPHLIYFYSVAYISQVETESEKSAK
jgi:hypothetical protein